jgi:hypothetical protein
VATHDFATIPFLNPFNMRKKLLLMALPILATLAVLYASRPSFFTRNEAVTTALAPFGTLRNGDLIFQASLSSQSKAIQLATKSRYSHCGIVYQEGKDFYVFEAVQPVKRTPLQKWIARGEGGKYVVKRLKNAEAVLTDAVIKKMQEEGARMKGKNYDLTFEWSDDRIYCSELIWKIYQRAAGIELGKLQKLKEFDLSSRVVRKKMQERYGDNIPWEEPVVSPAAVFESDLLFTVQSN